MTWLALAIALLALIVAALAYAGAQGAHDRIDQIEGARRCRIPD